ncbi:MAG: ABC transporter ATP-binding protein [Microthrixaceae bacterium]
MASPTTTAHPLRRLWDFAHDDHRAIVWGTAVSVLNKFFDVLPELLIGVAVDVVVRGRASLMAEWFGIDDRWTQLLVLAAVTVVVWGLESLTDYASTIVWRNLAQSIEHSARSQLYRHLQTLELAWFEDRSSGGLLSVVNDDVNQLERFLDVGAREVIRTATNVVLVGIFFFVVSPLLALVAFLPIPIIVAGSLRYQRRLEPHYADVRQAVEDLSGTLTNNLGGIATISSFVAEEREAQRVEKLSERYRHANERAIKVSSAFVPLIRMAILAAFVLTLVVGGRAAINGTLAVGVFSTLVFMTQRLLWPLTRMGEVMDLYQRAAASVTRILNLLAVRPGIVPGARTLPSPVRGAVRFDAIRFSYGAGGRDATPVLAGFDLDVAAGETHALVGTTGAGKSTVLKLLLRFYEPTGGIITIDGVETSQLGFAALRGAIGYVGQDTFLFDGTVAENLAYGRPDASRADLARAAELAEAAEFIRALPHGFDTRVGERGQKLSGGQRQRLSIARAIVADPAILVLDEATSSVDNETEAAIQRSLAKVSADRTTLIIAHRLSTVRWAHAIHVLEGGRVAESGTHDELVAAGGLYAALWRVQTGEAALSPD